jgi:hypothetical protein
MLAAGIHANPTTIGAIIALLGSLCALYASYLQRDTAAGSTDAVYDKLIAALVEAEGLQRSLRVLCPRGATPELNRVLSRANDVAGALNDLALRYG